MEINNSLEESLIASNDNEENIYFEIIYKLSQRETKIFDYSFINRNKDKCNIIYRNK